ncbi:MAG: hypothetical protein Tsb0021_02030 [Chlamydiales bacterium]
MQLPFSSKEIQTQLPKNITTIHAVAAMAFTSYCAFQLSATIFFWPVTVLGATYTAWTIYNHLIKKDPLTEAFYRIAGGKEQFEALPKIDLQHSPNEKLSERLLTLSWENLQHPISTATTFDQRKVVIIKGMSREEEQGASTKQTKAIFFFVEKLGPNDIPRHISDLPESAESVLYAISKAFTGNKFFHRLNYSHSSEDNITEIRFERIHSSIPGDMANEFYAQQHQAI